MILFGQHLMMDVEGARFISFSLLSEQFEIGGS